MGVGHVLSNVLIVSSSPKPTAVKHSVANFFICVVSKGENRGTLQGSTATLAHCILGCKRLCNDCGEDLERALNELEQDAKQRARPRPRPWVDSVPRDVGRTDDGEEN